MQRGGAVHVGGLQAAGRPAGAGFGGAVAVARRKDDLELCIVGSGRNQAPVGGVRARHGVHVRVAQPVHLRAEREAEVNGRLVGRLQRRARGDPAEGVARQRLGRRQGPLLRDPVDHGLRPAAAGAVLQHGGFAGEGRRVARVDRQAEVRRAVDDAPVHDPPLLLAREPLRLVARVEHRLIRIALAADGGQRRRQQQRQAEKWRRHEQ